MDIILLQMYKNVILNILTGTFFCVTTTAQSFPLIATEVSPPWFIALKAYSVGGKCNNGNNGIICLISSNIKFNTVIYVPHVHQNFVFLPAGGENSSYNVKVNICIFNLLTNLIKSSLRWKYSNVSIKACTTSSGHCVNMHQRLCRDQIKTRQWMVGMS